VNYTEKLHKLGLTEYPSKKPDISRIRSALKELNDPQDKFLSIHIAGTNGKGSTAIFLSEILRANGYKVGLYTSPHLIKVYERIKINQANISEIEFEEILKDIWGVVEKFSLTYFEILTLVAFVYFSEEKVDISVIETGLGGKYDATNTIRNVIASIITPIDFDHTELLGNKIEDIAKEKAGIIKKNTYVVSSGQRKEVEKIIKKTCESLNCKLFILGKDFNYRFLSCTWSVPEQKFSYFDDKFSYSGICLKLLGKHQLINASVAIKCANLLKNKGYTITEESIKEALKNAQWPARFQIINCNGKKIIIDGAHNPHGSSALFMALKDSRLKNKSITFVMNVMKEKNYREMIEILSPLAKDVIIFKSKNPRSVVPDVLYSIWENFMDKKNIKIESDLDKIFRDIKKEKVVCFTGSLYFAGEVLSYLNEKKLL